MICTCWKPQSDACRKVHSDEPFATGWQGSAHRLSKTPGAKAIVGVPRAKMSDSGDGDEPAGGDQRKGMAAEVGRQGMLRDE